jgi:hypothetical protein
MDFERSTRRSVLWRFRGELLQDLSQLSSRWTLRRIQSEAHFRQNSVFRAYAIQLTHEILWRLEESVDLCSGKLDPLMQPRSDSGKRILSCERAHKKYSKAKDIRCCCKADLRQVAP